MPRQSSFDVDDVIREGQYYGWEYVDYQWSQGELVILEKYDQNSDRLKINIYIWCTTGTVGTYLKHPRQGKTQLFRRDCYTMNDLRDIFANPRAHGYGGYHERAELDRRQQAPPPRERTVACPGCGRMHFTLGDTAAL